MLSILQAFFTVIGVIVTIIGIAIVLLYRSDRRLAKNLEDSARRISKIKAEIAKKKDNKKGEIIYINNLGRNKEES